MTANTQSQAIVRVVDDDPDVRRSWQFVIEGEGWNVLTYASALEFLEKDSPFTPGCLVLDVRMPGMSGIELQHEMKLRGDTLPIIFISAHGDIDMAVKTMNFDFFGFAESGQKESRFDDLCVEAALCFRGPPVLPAREAGPESTGR